MIQKATWIIPGILVTLLLGLLWAMPAFAADAGEIEFLSPDGKKAITHVSLNGTAAKGGFNVQVEDQDLNEPTAYTADGIGRYEVTVAEVTGIDWTDLADMSGDGKINANDILVFSNAEEDETANDRHAQFRLDVVNGSLNVGESGVWLEFELNEQLTIGAFVSTKTDDVTSDSNDRVEGETTVPRDPSLNDQGQIPNLVEFETPVFDTDADARLVTVDGENGDPAVTWLGVLADPDGDGNLAEHIMATVNVEYTDTDNATQSVEGVSLKVSVIEDREPLTVVADGITKGDLIGYMVRVSGVGVTVKKPTDAHADVPAQIPVVIVNDTVGTVSTDENITASGITLSYATVYQDMGSADQIGLVTVDSSGGTRTSVALRETSASSGQFRAMVEICDSGDTDDTPEDTTPNSVCRIGQSGQEIGATADEQPGMVMLPVNAAGDTITVRYRDAAPRTSRSANISLDTNAPAFSGITPDSGTAGKNAEPDVSFEVVDGESGIASDDDDDANSLRIVAALFEADAETDSLIDGPVMLDRDDLNVDEVTDGFSVEARLREGNNVEANELNAGTEDEYEIRWWAVATDVSGNTGVSDSDSDTPCTYSGAALYDGDDLIVDDLLVAVMAAQDVGTDDEVNCDPHVIRVDSGAPTLVSAVTGVFFDADEPNDEGTGSLTSIVARFDEALDCDSVTAADFEVDGTAPNDATCKGSNVYLDVDEIDSNDTPDVSVAEEAVGDRAGNLIGEDAEVESTDGVPAGISVTVVGTASGDRPVTDSTITITVSSDEKLSGRPMVQIRQVGDDYTLGSSDFGGTADPTGNTNEWEFEEDLDDAGLYNVYVTAEDRVNSGDSMAGLQPGVVGPDPEDATKKVTSTTKFTLDADDLKSNKVILFEVDNAVSDPTYDPEDDGETDNANIFIRVNFENEGNEYGLEALTDKDTPTTESKDNDTRDATDTPGDVDTDFDTQSTITVVSAEFDGVDVMDDLITRDWILYVYRPGDLTDGDHKLELEVEDSAGNEEEFTLEFAKVARKPYSLPINPGPNLVSFPANPEDGDVNAVFGGEGNEDITRVLTFDNASGLWMAATKGADGMFVGELTTIDAMHGYWVVSDGVLSVEAVLEGGDRFDRPPPHIAVQKGWNLVPVADTAQSEAGTMIATSDYFANIDAEVLYGYNSFAGRLDRLSTAKAVDSEDQDNVETGAAYWVYANEAGIIIP